MPTMTEKIKADIIKLKTSRPPISLNHVKKLGIDEKMEFITII